MFENEMLVMCFLTCPLGSLGLNLLSLMCFLTYPPTFLLGLHDPERERVSRYEEKDHGSPQGQL
jgi:hypothetical protein